MSGHAVLKPMNMVEVIDAVLRAAGVMTWHFNERGEVVIDPGSN